jgi:predicted DNA-binding transcriptional regulator AlpA
MNFSKTRELSGGVSQRVSDFDALPGSARMNTNEVAAITGIAQGTLRKMVRLGRWPTPQRISGSSRATWSAQQIRDLLKGGSSD